MDLGLTELDTSVKSVFSTKKKVCYIGVRAREQKEQEENSAGKMRQTSSEIQSGVKVSL